MPISESSKNFVWLSPIFFIQGNSEPVEEPGVRHRVVSIYFR